MKSVKTDCQAEAIIFDFDGTLIDSAATQLQSWMEVFTDYGVEFPVDLWKQGIGDGRSSVAPWTYIGSRVTAHEREAREAARQLRQQELADMLGLMPGALRHIKSARAAGLKLAVASSSSYGWVHGHLARLGLQSHFECVVTGAEAPVGKPSPCAYEVAVRALGVHPSRAVAIEDSGAGCEAARSAGVTCVAVPQTLTLGQDFSAAALVVTSLEDLTPDALWAVCR